MSILFAVPSKGRPENVARFADDTHWFVPPDQVEIYEENGAKNVHADTGWPQVRNQMLDYAFENGYEYCVQLDDDLKKTFMLSRSGRKLPCSYKDITNEIIRQMSAFGCRLGGVPPVANDFYMSHAVKPNLFIIGSFSVVRNTHLRFDESLLLKEDYDYTMQHIKEYGRVARVDWCGAEFQHYSNPGGCVSIRDKAMDQKYADILVKRWRPHIKPHPRREAEVLLRAKMS